MLENHKAFAILLHCHKYVFFSTRIIFPLIRTAMNISDIISVNPGRLTLGYLHPEKAGRLLRKTVIVRNLRNTHKSRYLNAVFTCTAPQADCFGSCMLLFRFLFAALLIVNGSFIASGEIYAPRFMPESSVFSIVEIVAGSLLAIGLFTRPVMTAVAIGLGIMTTEAVAAGVFDSASLAMLFGSVVFVILGSGKYSCDFLIRKAIILRRRKAKKEEMTYKAFSKKGNW